MVLNKGKPNLKKKVKWIKMNPENRSQDMGKLSSLTCAKKSILISATLLPTLRLGLMDKTYFLNHVSDHKYVDACGALQVWKPRTPHEILLAVGGCLANRQTGFPTNIIEIYHSRTDKWVNVSANMENVEPRIVLREMYRYFYK